MDGRLCEDCTDAGYKEPATKSYLLRFEHESGAPQWKELKFCDWCYMRWILSPSKAAENRQKEGLPSL